MTEQQYEEMMRDLMNDPDYLAYCDENDRQAREAMDRLSDEEIAAIYESF